MTLAPYSVCGGTSVGVTPLQVTVGSGISGATGVSAGSAMVAVACAQITGNAPTGVSDSQSNTWTQTPLSVSFGGFTIGMWVALNVTPLVSGTDWVKAVYTPGTGNNSLIVRAFPVTMTSNAFDAYSTGQGHNTSPSTGATGPLQQQAEWAVAAIANGSGGGPPASWTGGFTAFATLGTNPYLTVADQVTTSAAALTGGATVTTSNWVAGVVTIQLAVPPPPIIRPPLAAAVHRAAWW